ncbi:TNF receptor-associated factor 3 isoform X2 [Gouania willdenowi]|uniref:TNF receptor-associated factor n=1 Tax=Gouania willdenowi TaxID=441366 RepID=A0A8C5HVZ1_GOUWI|nr:TNF receptor-associated factor 3 isoform X2 [Gouania willdenowi]
MSTGSGADGREVQLPLSAAPPSQRSANHWPPGFLPVLGGFKERFVEKPEKKYCCEACMNVLCQPQQTECGHRFCLSCISNILSQQSPVCPADMEPLFKDKVFRDVCCHREIMALKVLCRSESNGCKETMSLQQIPEHLNVCPFFEVPCPLMKCKERMMRKEIPEHLNWKCKHRESSCEFCCSKMALIDLQKHKDTVCPAFPVSCPNHCSSSSRPRSEMTLHQQECPKAVVTCPFHRYGCSFKGLNQDVKQHELTFAPDHLRMLANRNVSLENKVEEVKVELVERCSGLVSLNSRLTELHSSLDELKEKQRQVEVKVSAITKLMSSHSEKLLDVELELRTLRQLREDTENLRGTLDNLRLRLSAVEQQGGRSNTTHTVASLETQMNRHDEMLSVHEIRLADMDLRFQVLETASYNGTLIWKIREYKRRKQDAVSAKTLSLYSQPFYTGYFGYKMCARVYLNGDGMGKGTHLSLFFVVMRGEYDALLPWPFKQKVTLMLMDQSPSRKHLGDAFKPDPNSSSFRRPGAEMNIASGCPLFVSQSVLETGSYIKDDTIFIKVTVDTSDLPDP